MLGAVPNPVETFSFDLANGQTVVIVVNEVNQDAGCAGYSVTIEGLCGGGTPTPTPSGTPTPTPCGTPTWVIRTPVPYEARGIFAASDGTFVYAGGGYDGFDVHSDLLRYDPVANSWTPLASSPDQHFLSQAVYDNGKIYNMGGFDGGGGVSNITRIYTVATNTWTTGAPMPATLTDQATALWNGIIYVAAGYDGSGGVNTLYAYNIAANSWTTLAPLPQALFLPGFGTINGKLYIASGNDGFVELNTLYIYDIATNTWSTGATVPQPVTGPGSTVFNGKLYLYGGGFPTTTTVTQIYDPVSNTWSAGPNLNVSRLWFYGTAVGGDTIVAPGGDQVPGIPVNTNEQLISPPCTPTPTPTADGDTNGNANSYTDGNTDGNTDGYTNGNANSASTPTPTPTATPPPTPLLHRCRLKRRSLGRLQGLAQRLTARRLDPRGRPYSPIAGTREYSRVPADFGLD